jgi:hypothetical protein
VKKRLLLVLPCLIASLLLVACGGEEGEEEPSDTAQIEDTITFAAVSGDPLECTEASTPAFLEQRTDKTGAAAIKACEEEDESEDLATDVTVSNIEVDGFEATADAKFAGSLFDGQTMTIALVKDDGQWKLDQVTSFAAIDKEALAKTFEGLFKETVGDSLTGAQISCLVDGVREAPEQQLEEAFLDESPEFEAALQKKCA